MVKQEETEKGPLTDLPSSLISKLLAEVEPLSQHEESFAAFDADGTLWDADVGESFFQFVIDNRLVSLPANPWQHYLNWKAKDPIAAYSWLAQMFQGEQVSQVRQWAQENFEKRQKETNWPVFDGMKTLIAELSSLSIKCKIVTASVSWAVEPFAALVGLQATDVIGIETLVEDGIISEKIVEPITWREGKAERLLSALIGRKPLLACGNTFGDIALLKLASVALAVSTQSQRTPLFFEEWPLYQAAQEAGWYHHQFRPLP